MKVMLIVPHQDDEVNNAGPLIYTLARCGCDITLVYTTNGDHTFKAEKRYKEAFASAKLLGIPEEKIVFLGYGDIGYGDPDGSKGKDRIFLRTHGASLSPAGHGRTYSVLGHNDYAFEKTGKHHSYNAVNYLNDIISVIEDHRPQLIISGDLDEHPDHRILSLYIDKALGILRKKDPSFRPELLKSFTYAFAYASFADMRSRNNPETKPPVVGVTGRYSYDLIGKFNYSWSDRVRIPMPQQMRCELISDSLLTKAMEQHRSQFLSALADRILNSDELFWLRRSDNIAQSAKVTVSSGCAKPLNDYMIYDIKDLDRAIPQFEDYYWKPDEDDTSRKAVLRWDKPTDIERIVVYGALSEDSQITKLRIRLSDGSVFDTGALPKSGSALTVDLGRHTNIISCEIRIISSEGENFGISEIEVFPTAEYTSVTAPFCKILVKDNFAYEYVIGKSVKSLPIGVYKFGSTGEISLSVVKGRSVLKNGRLFIDKDDREIVLRAYNSRTGVFDKAVIQVCDRKELARFARADRRNADIIRHKRMWHKFYNMRMMFREDGIGYITDKEKRKELFGKLRRMLK